MGGCVTIDIPRTITMIDIQFYYYDLVLRGHELMVLKGHELVLRGLELMVHSL